MANSFWSNPRSYILDRFFIKNPKFRRWVTSLLYGNRNEDIDLFGTHLTINSIRENGYLRAFRRVRSCSLWRGEIGGLLALFAVIRRGDLFVDVGANIGVFACTIARLPGVEVVAFEANPLTYQRLAVNAQRVGVRAEQVAISDAAGEIEFVDGAVSHVFAAAIHKNQYHFGKSVKVNASRLDLLLDDKKPMVLKIDVEDHECEVINGAAKLLDKGLVKAVMLDSSGSSGRAAELLKARGFRTLDAQTLGPVRPDSSSYILLSKDRCELLGFDSDLPVEA